jgi:hypothetical protein
MTYGMQKIHGTKRGIPQSGRIVNRQIPQGNDPSEEIVS